MIHRRDILAHLDNSVRAGALTAGKDYVPKRSLFVQEYASDSAEEQYANMGDPPWPLQNAGQAGDGGTDSRTNAVQVGNIRGGRQITILGGEERSIRVANLDWEISTAVTHNAINDNKLGDLEDWANDAVSNFEKHKDYECFNALNSGAANTNFGDAYDNLSFFNDSHVDPGAEYTTAQDNSYGSVLSLDNFETVTVAGAKFNNSRGQPVGLNHNILIGPPDLKRTMAQITDNTWAYDTGNYEINPYVGTQGLVSPGGWLDSTAWFVVDGSMRQKPLGLQIRQEPMLESWDEKAAGDGGVRIFKFHARYVVFYQDWRLCIQGNT